MLSRDVFQVQRDGLHDIVQTPEFQGALGQAIASYFGPIFEPGLLESLRRFLSKGRRNYSFSVSARTPANGGPTKLVDMDEARVELWVTNNGSVPIYWGGRQVTTGPIGDPNAGTPISPGITAIIEHNVGEVWVATGTDAQDVRVIDIAGGIAKP